MEDPRLLAALDQVGERFGRREQWAIQARSLFTLLPAALTEDVVGALLACLEPDRKTGKVKHRTAVYDGKFLEAVARRRISDRLTGAAERSASPAESIFDEDELELLEQSGDEHVA